MWLFYWIKQKWAIKMYATRTTKNAAAVFAQSAVCISNPAFVAEHLSNFKFESFGQRNFSSETRLCVHFPLIHIYNDYWNTTCLTFNTAVFLSKCFVPLRSLSLQHKLYWKWIYSVFLTRKNYSWIIVIFMVFRFPSINNATHNL